MGRPSEENRFERAEVAVCWSTTRQQWLLCNVSDRHARQAERAMFVEVFTQGLLDDEWVWRDSYYPTDDNRRVFWSHQFAEDGTPHSVELAELEQEWPTPRIPENPARVEPAHETVSPAWRRAWAQFTEVLRR